jgi:asparagine synthase (glutamine-hydrolysing)
MNVCGGNYLEKMAARMGMPLLYTTGCMACSEPGGVTQGLVCDADIYGVKSPAEYLKRILEHSGPDDVVHAVEEVFTHVRGGYACAVEWNGSVYVFRDPVGLAPLYYLGGSFASEKKAFPSPPTMVVPGQVVKLPSTPLTHYGIKGVPSDPHHVLDALTESANIMNEDAVLLFSGGIDSCLLAAILDIPLLTCGLENSQDITFSRRAARLLKKEHREVILSQRDIQNAYQHVCSVLQEKTLLDIEIGLLIEAVCQNCDEDILISGQGADELFGGYYKYEQAFHQKKDVQSMMRKDLSVIHKGLERDRQVAQNYNKKVRYPYLAVPVIENVLDIPVSSLFIPSRKAFLRKMADLMSLPEEIVARPKKALQYGSGIHKVVKKLHPLPQKTQP